MNALEIRCPKLTFRVNNSTCTPLSLPVARTIMIHIYIFFCKGFTNQKQDEQEVEY